MRNTLRRKPSQTGTLPEKLSQISEISLDSCRMLSRIHTIEPSAWRTLQKGQYHAHEEHRYRQEARPPSLQVPAEPQEVPKPPSVHRHDHERKSRTLRRRSPTRQGGTESSPRRCRVPPNRRCHAESYPTATADRSHDRRQSPAGRDAEGGAEAPRGMRGGRCERVPQRSREGGTSLRSDRSRNH